MTTVAPNGLVACVLGLPLFQGLTLSDCAEIVSLAQERLFWKNQTIFREGDPVKSVFVVVSGRVKITETSRAGSEVILNIEESGGPVGELGLTAGCSHTRTAQALERCHVLVWEATRFQAFCEQYPKLTVKSVWMLSERLRVLEARFQELATEHVAPRLALTLVRLLERKGNGAPKPAPIGLSHEELAQMTGMTLSTVSRLLSEWERRGIVTIRYKSILIKDLSGLITLAKGAA
jgi:CRP-like cAMP-binding protein